MDPRKPILKRNSTHLPHWEQEGAEVFVTFRLADSLPQEIVKELAAERRELEARLSKEHWLKSDEEWHRLKTLQSRRVEALLDEGKGSCVLGRKDVAGLMADVLRFFDGKRYRLLAWCVMPNHVHVVFVLLAEWPLAKVLHSWKSFSSKRINALIGKSGALWQREYFDRLLRGPEELRRAVQYVLENPIKARLVNWPWVDVALDGGF